MSRRFIVRLAGDNRFLEGNTAELNGVDQSGLRIVSQASQLRDFVLLLRVRGL